MSPKLGNFGFPVAGSNRNNCVGCVTLTSMSGPQFSHLLNQEAGDLTSQISMISHLPMLLLQASPADECRAVHCFQTQEYVRLPPTRLGDQTDSSQCLSFFLFFSLPLVIIFWFLKSYPPLSSFLKFSVLSLPSCLCPVFLIPLAAFSLACTKYSLTDLYSLCYAWAIQDLIRPEVQRKIKLEELN